MIDIVGTARIVDEGLDTDTMLRYAVYEFDPPLDGKRSRERRYMAMTDDMLPLPQTNDMLRDAMRRDLRLLGYELVE